MKTLFFIFCFFLFPLTSLAEIKEDVAAQEAKVSDLQAQVNRCNPKCSSTLTSKLSKAKSDLNLLKSDLNLQNQEDEIAAQNAQARRDARRELRKQKDSLYKEAAVNGAFAVWMFTKCKGGGESASDDPGPGDHEVQPGAGTESDAGADKGIT